MKRNSRFPYAVLLLAIFLIESSLAFAQDAPPPAEIVNDEGGPVAVTGEVVYTNTIFTDGAAQPLIILEDQAGFVDRDTGFLMPTASQVLGQITSDFYASPFTYSISLPIEPQGTYRDVDQDGKEEQGVQIYAVAYWTNTWGDPYLEERDLFGGGWSSAYASTRVSEDAATLYEYTGGKILVFATDAEQGFPSSFGEDGKLFTEDDPIVTLPQGYTVVDMDTDPFTFDRSRNPQIDLIEPEGAALDDYSGLSYTEAFDAMIEKFREEYAFTELKEIDWDAKSEEFRPRFEQAEADADPVAYAFALRDFTWSIPDGHVAMYPGSAEMDAEFQNAISGGIGMALRQTDTGTVIVTFLTPEGPAEAAGIELVAEVSAINGTPIDEYLDSIVPYSSPFSTDHTRRLQQLRYGTRFPLGDEVEVTYTNPGGEETTVTLTASGEFDSFRITSFSRGLTGFELPVEYRLLDSGLMYARIMSFADNDLLSIQLWERMIQAMNINGIPGLIIDMRQNGGGSGFLSDQMAAYFFDEAYELGNTALYDPSTGNFEVDENRPGIFYPPSENLRYYGEIAVLVGPACSSACEFFADALTTEGRAAVVGQYPTGGLGGSIQDFLMPEGFYVRMTIGRAFDENGDIHIEGSGVEPTVQVPVDETTLFAEDAVLDAAEVYLIEALEASVSADLVVTDGGTIEMGETAEGEIAAGERVQYVFTAENDVVVNIIVSDADGALDSYLRVYDVDGNLIAENDDIEPGVQINSAVEGLEISAGTSVVVEAATYDDAASGAYTLEIAEVQ